MMSQLALSGPRPDVRSQANSGQGVRGPPAVFAESTTRPDATWVRHWVQDAGYGGNNSFKSVR